MMDGPQALASEGATLRQCERMTAAVGKTPDVRPPLSRIFAGFICSSLDLFTALRDEHIPISLSHHVGSVSEVYPGHIWTLIGGGRPLPGKATELGRLVRKRMLQALGVCGLEDLLPSHDQNDACVAALVAAAADNHVPGMIVQAIGHPLSTDPDGAMREGPMIIPAINDVIVVRIAEALEDCALPAGSLSANIVSTEEAEKLLQHFIERALAGEPQVCTYAWAYRHLVDPSYAKFSQQYARRVIDLARRTQRRELNGLGLVHLDTFIVAKNTRLPSDGYWVTAHHDREDWERVLGGAQVLDKGY